MRLIKPSFEIIEQQNILQHIELCGRVCYKSEDKITASSADKFVRNLINSGHTSVLEHGTVYLHIINDYWSDVQKYIDNKYSKCVYKLHGTYDPNGSGEDFDAYITTNYRVLVENGWLNDLQYQCEPTEYHEKRVSVRFICDRGVSHEFVRHRTFSFSQESTRYCNYSKDKFGNECNFIIPIWMGNLEEGIYSYNWSQDYIETPNGKVTREENEITFWYLYLLSISQIGYNTLSKLGWVAQQARSVLPNSLKTELIMTGSKSQWKHFFKLRCASSAHPQARELAMPLCEEFIERGYIDE